MIDKSQLLDGLAWRMIGWELVGGAGLGATYGLRIVYSAALLLRVTFNSYNPYFLVHLRGAFCDVDMRPSHDENYIPGSGGNHALQGGPRRSSHMLC